MGFPRRVIGWCFTACLLICHSGLAQVTTGDIVGRITDATAAVMPEVAVTVENEHTRERRLARTNASGDFAVNLLPIGPYILHIEAAGFTDYTATLTLAAGDRVRVDVRLQVSAVTEEVQVSGSRVPGLQTENATLRSLVTERAVQDLPLNGRNFVRLVQLSPGATEGLPNSLASGTRPDDRRPTSAVSLNGQPDTSNNHLIDGLDNNERAIGTIGVKPSIDAIAEVQVQTNLYAAEVGRTTGGVINVITKSGTNELRGSAYEFARNERFDARNFFASTGPKPALRQNQFGGSAGGPLKQDRTFFFADYEALRQVQGSTSLSTVPTERMRRADFSELLAQPRPVIIYDPVTSPRSPFPGNVIPAERLDAIALRYLALYPLPTTSGLANNFTSTANRTMNGSTADVRLDHRFGDGDTLFARYSLNDVSTFTPGPLPPVGGVHPGGLTNLYAGASTVRADSVHLKYMRILSATTLSELNAGYLGLHMQSLPLNYGTNLSERFGLSGVNIDPTSSALAPMIPAGYASVGDGLFLPLVQDDDTWQATGALAHSRGAHNLKLGGGVIARGFSVFQSNSPAGNFSFTAALTDDGAGGGGNSIASFLLGHPSQIIRIKSLVFPRYRTWEPHVYLQDDWRAASWLTVNMGIRYDIFTPFTEAADRIANLDLDTGQILIAGVNGVSRSAGVHADFLNVAPRAGFSAMIGPAVVLRGGYGLSFYPGNQTSYAFLKNPPFVSTFGPVISAGAAGLPPTLRLADGLQPPLPSDPDNPSGSILAVDRNFRSTYAHQYNVVVEQEIGANTVEAGYTGSRARRVAMPVGNVNLAPPGAGPVQPRRAYAGRLPEVNTISYLTSRFASAYDALQLAFHRRHRRGITVSSHYRWARGIAAAAAPNVPARDEWGPSDVDVRHRWTLTANYALPRPGGLGGTGGEFLAGWQLNVAAFWQTGLPFTVVNATPRSNTGVGANLDRPNRVGAGTLDRPTPERWFDTSAFVAQPLNTIGNSGRNILYGPPQRRLDLSVFKHVRIREAVGLQFRVECFNVTNTPNFASPNAQLGSPAFAAISSTGNTSARELQVALKLLFR